MMPFRPDLVIKEVPAPWNNRCRSCGKAPKMFRRGGTKAPEEPMRFFRLSSDAHPEANDTYCERCLIVANALNATRR